MKRVLLLAALTLAACGGPPGPRWPADAESRTWAVPVVMAWRPARLLIEAQIEAVGPVVVAVDPGLPESLLLRSLADRLKLPTTRRRDRDRVRPTWRLPTVDETQATSPTAPLPAGPALVLAETPMWLVDAPDLGLVQTRPIVAVLGADAFQGQALEFDPGAGVLRVLTPNAPPLPMKALPARVADGRWQVKLEVEDQPLWLVLSPGSLASALRPDIPVPAGIGRVSFIGHPRRLIAFAPGAPAGADGVLGLGALVDLVWRFDARRDAFSVLPTVSEDRLRRFTDAPDCGAHLADCVRGFVDDIRPGQVALSFRKPSVRLPPRLWARVDLGLPNRPYTVLVQFGDNPDGIPRAFTLDDPKLTPDSIRRSNAPLTVLDVVPVPEPCPGVVCVRRQEGDVAAGFVESSSSIP